MKQILAVLMLGWISCLAVRPEVAPLAEPKQAAMALSILDSYHGPRPPTPPRRLYVVYFTPADRAPAPQYEQRLTAILRDIQSFYRDGMQRAGFGSETFPLESDTNQNVLIHLVKGQAPEGSYSKPDSDKIISECKPVLAAAGISIEQETVLIFCNLATFDEPSRTFSHHSPYYGMWNQTSGLCFALDSVILNDFYVPRTEPQLDDDEYGSMSLGRFNTVFIGGIAHELGHAFALPHCGERWDQQALGTSLMGAGNRRFREEMRGEGLGAFLTFASALHLAGRPLFNGSDKGLSEEPRLQQCELKLSTKVTSAGLIGRRGTFRVEGTVVGTPPVYGVIAYFDSHRDGGYTAPTGTAVPDAQGRFAIEVSDLAPATNGELRVEFCHVNGTTSEQHIGFRVDARRAVDISEWEQRQALEPIAVAVASHQLAVARAALQKLEAGNALDYTKLIGRKLTATLEDVAKSSPADVSTTIANFALGDAQAESASVGWLQPSANRVPPNDQIFSPLLDSGRLYATGLYAHAPSRYVFNLGGKWGRLSGEAGLHTLQQPFGAVIFSIRADGQEVFRSAAVRGADQVKYQINLAGVQKLELIVDPAADNNSNDWGLWLDPTLSR